MKKYIKQKYLLFIGILIGIILSGATVYAATQIMATDVVYDNTTSGLKKSNGEDVTNAQEALDVLSEKASVLNDFIINRVSHIATYKYWNNNFAGSSYQFASNAIPTGSGLSGTYDSRAALASAYSSFSTYPIYIKSTQINGNTYGHTACLWYNNQEFCLGPNYWTGTIGTQDSTAAENTKKRLKAEMELALGVTASSCFSGSVNAECYFGSFNCYANYYGNVYCYSGSRACYVTSSGSAYCG